MHALNTATIYFHELSFLLLILNSEQYYHEVFPYLLAVEAPIIYLLFLGMPLKTDVFRLLCIVIIESVLVYWLC